MKPIILPAFGLLLLLGRSGPLAAQSPIVSFSAGYQSAASAVGQYVAKPVAQGTFGGCSGTQYTYTFSNGTSNCQVSGYTFNNFEKRKRI